MTAEEFTVQYATRSAITVMQLHDLGRYAAPCDCGAEDCPGWQMVHLENAYSDRETRWETWAYLCEHYPNLRRDQ